MKLYQTQNAKKVYGIINEKNGALLMADFLDEVPGENEDWRDYEVRRFIVKRGNLLSQFILKNPHNVDCYATCLELAEDEFYNH